MTYFENVLVSSPIATPTTLSLSPRQTSQLTFHFVPSKTFSRNKTHQITPFSTAKPIYMGQNPTPCLFPGKTYLVLLPN